MLFALSGSYLEPLCASPTPGRTKEFRRQCVKTMHWRGTSSGRPTKWSPEFQGDNHGRMFASIETPQQPKLQGLSIKDRSLQQVHDLLG